MSGSDQVVISVRECVGDFDPADGDVDGSDLEQLAAAPSLLNLSDFAVDFGRKNCINP